MTKQTHNRKSASATTPCIIRFVIGSLDVGGTETHLCRVLPQLKNAGFQPVVVTLTHKGVMSPALERLGIPVYEPTGLVRRLCRIPVLSRLIALPATIIYLVARYRRTPAALTCFYLPSSYYLGMLAAIVTGQTANTIMFRRSLNHYQRERPLIAYLERRLHQRQWAIVGNSEAVVRELVECEDAPRERVTLIYNGIDIPAQVNDVNRTAFRHSLGVDDQTIVMCIVANLIPYKGHLDLVDALAGIAARIAEPWVVLCVGRGIEQRSDLSARVRATGLERHIRWLGQRDDVPEILAAADIGLLVSHQEGFSNAVLEGMAAGLPMIVTDVGGNREAVVHRQCGLVVPPAQPSSLGEAILELVNNRELAERYGRAARIRVAQRFSMTTCIEQYLDLFNRACRK